MADDVIEMDGYRIAVGEKWFCSELDLGSLEWRDQDVDRPGGVGRLFGRDYATPGAIVLTLHTVAESRAEARKNVRELASAVGWSEDRAPPGKFESLSSTIAGAAGEG